MSFYISNNKFSNRMCRKTSVTMSLYWISHRCFYVTSFSLRNASKPESHWIGNLEHNFIPKEMFGGLFMLCIEFGLPFSDTHMDIG